MGTAARGRGRSGPLPKLLKSEVGQAGAAMGTRAVESLHWQSGSAGRRRRLGAGTPTVRVRSCSRGMGRPAPSASSAALRFCPAPRPSDHLTTRGEGAPGTV